MGFCELLQCIRVEHLLTSATRWTMPVAPRLPRCRSSESLRRDVSAARKYSICFAWKARSRCWETSMRSSRVERDTKETQIRGSLKLDGQGKYEISTGIRFLDHMLELFTKHGGFDLKLTAKGDLDVDQHHTVEDAGIVLGQLFSKALGDRKGINRAGYFVMPMDETLTLWSYTSAGRPPRSSATTAKVSSIGMTKYPARLMPFLSPSAFEKSWPSTMPASSTV